MTSSSVIDKMTSSSVIDKMISSSVIDKMTSSSVIKIMMPVTDKKNNVIRQYPTFMSSVVNKMSNGKFPYSLSVMHPSWRFKNI